MVSLYSGILFNYKKEETLIHEINGCTPNIFCQAKNARYKKLYVLLFHLHKSSRKGKSVVAYGWGGGRVDRHKGILGSNGFSKTVLW